MDDRIINKLCALLRVNTTFEEYYFRYFKGILTYLHAQEQRTDLAYSKDKLFTKKLYALGISTHHDYEAGDYGMRMIFQREGETTRINVAEGSYLGVGAN